MGKRDRKPFLDKWDESSFLETEHWNTFRERFQSREPERLQESRRHECKMGYPEHITYDTLRLPAKEIYLRFIIQRSRAQILKELGELLGTITRTVLKRGECSKRFEKHISLSTFPENKNIPRELSCTLGNGGKSMNYEIESFFPCESSEIDEVHKRVLRL